MMARIRAAFSAMHESDRFTEEFDAALSARRRPGPKTKYNAIVEIGFTPEQIEQMNQAVKAKRARSRNALVRDAVESYLGSAGA